MLKRFHANNFRSLLNFEFRPSGINLLVGHNNAGKTNLCNALRFLGLSSMTSLENAAFSAVGETWNLTNAYVTKALPNIELQIDCSLVHEGLPLEFSYKLVLTASTENSVGREQVSLAEELLTVSGGPFAQTILLDNKNGQARLLHEEGFVQKRPDAPYYAETLAPYDSTMLSKLYELKDNPRASLFKRYLRSWLYFNFSPDALRLPDVLRESPFLRSDGANLGRSLNTLHNEDPRTEKKIIDAVKLVEPKLDLFSYRSPDPEHVYLFLEDEEGHRFGSRSISDGTLRYLAIAYILVVLQKQTKELDVRPLVTIEEPENGLYVGHLKPLVERLDTSGAHGQFIFTSHSPYFIDLFDTNLEGIHLIKPGKPSSVLVKPDPEKVRKLLNDMPLGEIHFRELLG